jgi:hypothetical protein
LQNSQELCNDYSLKLQMLKADTTKELQNLSENLK